MVKPIARDPSPGHAFAGTSSAQSDRPADHGAPAPQPEAASCASPAQERGRSSSRRRPPEVDEDLARRKRRAIEKKSTPYLPKHTTLDSLARLNGRVVVAEDTRASALRSPDPLMPVSLAQASVVCRHLATGFALRRGKKTELLRAFSSPNGIQEFFGGRLRAVDAQYSGVIAAAGQNCKHVLKGAQLGRYVSNLAAALNQRQAANVDAAHQSEVNCLLFTARHVTALHVALKQKEGVRYFSAKLFDPNLTNTYLRVEALDAESLAGLTYADLSARERLRQRASANDGHLAAVCVDGEQLPPIPRLDAHPAAENMHLALALGMSEEFERLTADAADLPPQQIVSLMEARSERMPDFPGLHVAVVDDQPASIRPFFDAVMARPSLRDSRMTLLTAPDSAGRPALAMALSTGSAAGVRAYVSAVIQSQLGPEEKRELLVSRDPHGFPGLLHSMLRDREAAVSEYVRAVANADSLGDIRMTLLAASRRDETTALAYAVSNAQVIAIDAYVDALTSSSMNRTDQVELLKGRTVSGVPALNQAMRTGNEFGVTFYVRAVTASGLPEEDKRQLLEARDPAGVTGQQAALDAGQEVTMRAFRRAVMSSNLSAATKTAVTAARL